MKIELWRCDVCKNDILKEQHEVMYIYEVKFPDIDAKNSFTGHWLSKIFELCASCNKRLNTILIDYRNFHINSGFIK